MSTWQRFLDETIPCRDQQEKLQRKILQQPALSAFHLLLKGSE
jgi:hypothetical protein